MKMVYHSTNIGYCLYATTTQYAFYNLKKKNVETKPSNSQLHLTCGTSFNIYYTLRGKDCYF